MADCADCEQYCEKIPDKDHYKILCCYCAELELEKMCEPCRLRRYRADETEAEYADLKSQGMKECEICDAPHVQGVFVLHIDPEGD